MLSFMSKAIPYSAMLKQIVGLLKSQQYRQAAESLDHLLTEDPANVDAWQMRARAAQGLGDFARMIEACRQWAALQPGNPQAKLLLSEALIASGDIAATRSLLDEIETRCMQDAGVQQQVAGLYSACTRYDDALRCYRRAADLQPEQSATLYNLAAALVTKGELVEAERLFNRCIDINPHDYDAYRNRSTLRKQTPDNNHVAQLRKSLAGEIRHPAGAVQLNYALAKELEDLGDHAGSFAALQQGAARRRRLLRYDVAGDEAAMQQISTVFSADLLARAPVREHGAGPIFILGLPRSGTTLVDRILGAHSDVFSLGEVNDLALAMVRQQGGATVKQQAIASAASLDFKALGAAYRASTRSYGYDAPFLIDKTPLNFLYVGLIALSLPEAKIVHVRRHPLASCFGMYKMLFRMGYPFSYDLSDIARYYVAYHRLMHHWRNLLGQRIIEIDYEQLVEDQEGQSRRLLSACDLTWQAACLDFHHSTAPTATASAVQVRQPIYRSALESWRNYQAQLAPLIIQLQAAGVATD